MIASNSAPPIKVRPEINVKGGSVSTPTLRNVKELPHSVDSVSRSGSSILRLTSSDFMKAPAIRQRTRESASEPPGFCRADRLTRGLRHFHQRLGVAAVLARLVEAVLHCRAERPDQARVRQL